MATNAGEVYIELRTHEDGLIAGMKRARGTTFETMDGMRNKWEKGMTGMREVSRRDLTGVTQLFGQAGNDINRLYFSIINQGGKSATAAFTSIGGAIGLAGAAIAGWEIGKQIKSWIFGINTFKQKMDEINEAGFARGAQQQADKALSAAKQQKEFEDKILKMRDESTKDIFENSEARLRIQKEITDLEGKGYTIEEAQQLVLEKQTKELQKQKDIEEERFKTWERNYNRQKDIENAVEKVKTDFKKKQEDESLARQKRVDAYVASLPQNQATIFKPSEEYLRKKEAKKERNRAMSEIGNLIDFAIKQRAQISERPRATWTGAEDVWRTSMAASANAGRDSAVERLDAQIELLKAQLQELKKINSPEDN